MGEKGYLYSYGEGARLSSCLHVLMSSSRVILLTCPHVLVLLGLLSNAYDRFGQHVVYADAPLANWLQDAPQQGFESEVSKG